MRYWLLDQVNRVQVWWAGLRRKPKHYRMHSKPVRFKKV